MIGLVASAMAIAPMIAPLIGGILDTLFGWQSIFVFAAAACLIVLVWTATTLPETRPQMADDVERRGSVTISVALFGNPRFIGYVLSAALGSGCVLRLRRRRPARPDHHDAPDVAPNTASGSFRLPAATSSATSSRRGCRCGYGVDSMLWWGNVIEFLAASLGVLAAAVGRHAWGRSRSSRRRHADGHRQWRHSCRTRSPARSASGRRPRVRRPALLGFTQMSFGALTDATRRLSRRERRQRAAAFDAAYAGDRHWRASWSYYIACCGRSVGSAAAED